MNERASPGLPRAVGRKRIGFVLTVLGAFWTVVGTCIAVFPSAKASADAGVFNAAMAVVLLLAPGLFLWFSARATAVRSDLVERLAALASVETRMPLSDAAMTLGISINEVRVGILDAVAAGLLRGHIDSEKGVFLASTAEHPLASRDVVCTRCGGRSSVVLRSDETAVCGYCGAPAMPAAS